PPARHALHVRRPRRDDLRPPGSVARRTAWRKRSAGGGEMRRSTIIIALVAAANAIAQVPVARVATDARVIDRVAEVSRNDLPTDVLRRIVNEDIDLLRGKRADGT